MFWIKLFFPINWIFLWPTTRSLATTISFGTGGMTWMNQMKILQHKKNAMPDPGQAWIRSGRIPIRTRFLEVTGRDAVHSATAINKCYFFIHTLVYEFFKVIRYYSVKELCHQFFSSLVSSGLRNGFTWRSWWFDPWFNLQFDMYIRTQRSFWSYHALVAY